MTLIPTKSDQGSMIDITGDKKARSIIITKNGDYIISDVNSDTLKKRVEALEDCPW